MKTILAVLDTMWGNRSGRAPRWFYINPRNASGRRLYRLCAIDYYTNAEPSYQLLVTNCCRELVTSANHHGKPDARWLADNLRRLKPDLILVCGKVAQRTFTEARRRYNWDHNTPVLTMAHPAARNWTKASIRRTARQIQEALNG